MKPDGSSDLASMLRALRQDAMLTQDELAGRSGVSVGTVAGLENGRSRRPRISSLRALADALGLDERRRSALIAAAQSSGGPPAPSPDRTPDRTTATTPDASDDAPVSTRLPPALRVFTGRREYLERLDALIHDRQRRASLITVSGTAGVGKTALAVTWAHRVRDRFPDGQLYLNLHGFAHAGRPTPTDQALRQLLIGLGLDVTQLPSTFDGQVAKYHALLAGRRVLVVLDNVRDARQVRPLLPAAPGCLAVVVSRAQLADLVVADGAQPVEVGVLSAPEARELLSARLGSARTSAEPDAVDAIIEQCARLPLALALLAARGALYPGFSLADLSGQLHDVAGLDTLSIGDDETNLRAVFSWSYRTLSDAAGQLFRLLGAYCGAGFTTAAAASVAGVPRPETATLLGELTRAHLADEQPAGRFAIHDLLGLYARDLSHAHDSDAARTAAVHRLHDYYLQSAHAAHARLELCTNPIDPVDPVPGVSPERPTDRPTAAAWFETERAALVATVTDAYERGRFDHAWQLAFSMHRFLGWAGHTADRLDTLRVGLSAAERLHDDAAQARVHRALALTLVRAGRYDAALTHCRAALARSTARGDQPAIADAEQDCAFVLEQQGRYDEALAHAVRAVDARRSDPDPRALARALNVAGWLHAHVGEYDVGLARCEAGLALLDPTADHTDRAYTVDSIGYIHQQRGDHARAARYYQQAVDLLGEVGDRLDAAGMLDRLAQARHAIGDHAGAREAWRRALPIFEARQNPAASRIRAQLGEPLPRHLRSTAA